MLSPPTSSLPHDTVKRRSQEAPHQSSAAAIHARAIIPPSPSSHPASRSSERGQVVRPLVLQVIQGVLDKTVRYSHEAQGSRHPALDDPNGEWASGEQGNRVTEARVCESGDHSAMEDGQAGPWMVPGGGEDRKKEGTTEMKGGNQEGGEGSEGG